MLELFGRSDSDIFGRSDSDITEWLEVPMESRAELGGSINWQPCRESKATEHRCQRRRVTTMQSSKVGLTRSLLVGTGDLCDRWVTAAERLLAESETGALPDETTLDLLSRAQLMIDAHNDRLAGPRSPKSAQSCAGHSHRGFPPGSRKPLRDGSRILLPPHSLVVAVTQTPTVS